MFDLKSYQNKLETAIDRFRDDIKKVRVGRAHPNQLDSVMVEAYGTMMPLNQVASVTAPEAQSLQITPFDVNNIEAISEAIRSDQTLDLNPSDDGRIVRVPIPPLTEERRQSIVKQISDKSENTKVAIRMIRQEALKDLKQLKESKQMSEDDKKRQEKNFDELIGKMNTEVDSILKDKEKEILTI